MTKRNVDLLIIRPGDKKKVYGNLSQSLAAIEPPLWAGLLAAVLREKGLSTAIIDTDAEDLSPEETATRAAEYDASLIAFVVTGNNLSASTWLMTGASLYHQAIKEKCPQTKTLFWGLHPSALPEQTIQEEHTDFVCQGEGFITLVALVKLLKTDPNPDRYDIPGLWYQKDGNAVANPPEPILKDLDSLPVVSWDLLPMDKYRAHNWHANFGVMPREPYGVLYTSLGCPFNCSFCALKGLFNGKPGIRYRSPQKVMDDIDVLVNDYGIKNIKVLDECFGLKVDHVTEICDRIIDRGYDLNIWAYASVDTIRPQMLEKMKQAGFTWLSYGIESGSKDILKGVSKARYGEHDIRSVVRMTKDAGINVLGNFMFGLPDDDLESMQATLELAKELNCEYTNFYATMAYPGADLYDEALKNNIPLPKTWRGYAAFSAECLPLPTKYLSAEDVLRFRDYAFDAFHSNPRFLKLIGDKFGPVAVDDVKRMLSHKLERDILK